MFDFDFFSLFVALAGISIGVALLVGILVSSDKIDVKCADV
jgi:NADH:ubiquinone oxidoreductase subunit K